MTRPAASTITASQPSSLAPARLWPRLLASLIDYLIILAYLLVVAAAGAALWSAGITSADTLSPRAMDILAFLVTVLPVTLYFAIQEGGPQQATIGKRRAGIRVMTTSGRPLGYLRALIRSAVKFAPWQLAHMTLVRIPGWPTDPTPGLTSIAWLSAAEAVAFIYLLSLLFTPSRRTPYDWIAGSTLVPAS